MAIITKSTSETITHLDDLLSSGNRVFYTRYGDGDILLMMGQNDKYHDVSPELQKELRDSFGIEDELYLKALAVNYPLEDNMMPGLFAPHYNNEELEKLIEDFFFIEKPPGIFESHIAFHYYGIFRQKEFNNFFDLHVRPKKKLLIGGVEPRIAEKLYGEISEYVETPFSNAYHTIDEWWPEVERKLSNIEIVIPSAGAASKVINKRLWDVDAEVTSLDIGSLIDGIDGRGSRKWIKLKGHKMNDILVSKYQNKSFQYRLKYLWKETYFQLRKVWKRIKPS